MKILAFMFVVIFIVWPLLALLIASLIRTMASRYPYTEHDHEK
jgi:heme/copper-type cytochrome/quinol oxidase subunit 2